MVLMVSSFLYELELFRRLLVFIPIGSYKRRTVPFVLKQCYSGIKFLLFSLFAGDWWSKRISKSGEIPNFTNKRRELHFFFVSKRSKSRLNKNCLQFTVKTYVRKFPKQNKTNIFTTESIHFKVYKEYEYESHNRISSFTHIILCLRSNALYGNVIEDKKIYYFHLNMIRHDWTCGYETSFRLAGCIWFASDWNIKNKEKWMKMIQINWMSDLFGE